MSSDLLWYKANYEASKAGLEEMTRRYEAVEHGREAWKTRCLKAESVLREQLGELWEHGRSTMPKEQWVEHQFQVLIINDLP